MKLHHESYVTANFFNCLFDTYKNRLYGYVLALTHSPYVAEEITQEIFVKLWRSRESLPGVANMDGYLFAMAKNKSLNYLRKAAHDARILRELQARMEPPAVNDVEERSRAADCDLLVREAVVRLSPQRRLVYQLSRQQGLNQDEIAVHLHLSRNTVKNHLVEALRLIRKHLSNS